jgi:hypothetical protein
MARARGTYESATPRFSAEAEYILENILKRTRWQGKCRDEIASYIEQVVHDEIVEHDAAFHKNLKKKGLEIREIKATCPMTDLEHRGKMT